MAKETGKQKCIDKDEIENHMENAYSTFGQKVYTSRQDQVSTVIPWKMCTPHGYIGKNTKNKRIKKKE